jgi:hypothetical protein
MKPENPSAKKPVSQRPSVPPRNPFSGATPQRPSVPGLSSDEARREAALKKDMKIQAMKDYLNSRGGRA